jgi:adenylate cyclase
VLAFFGALAPNPWQANDALYAALAMRTALVDYSAALRAEGLPGLEFGVGIHRGVVVTGVLGSAALVEYGVIGSAVNLAARIEELTRTHDVDILISAAVRDTIDRRFRVRAMPAVVVKGIPDPIVTYAVEGVADTGA